jgi:hypothetical protein
MRDLYPQLGRAFPGTWGTLPPDLQAELKADFELAMNKLCDNRSHAVAPLMQGMATFFAQFGLPLDRADGYSRLIAELHERGKVQSVLFSTLNYECLLEIALTTARYKIIYSGFSSATDSPSAVTVSKPHCLRRTPRVHTRCHGRDACGHRDHRDNRLGPAPRRGPPRTV